MPPPDRPTPTPVNPIQKANAVPATPDNPRDRAGLKHELRTVVRHVIGYAELLLDSNELTPVQQEDISRIDQSARALESMLEGFFVELPQRGSNDVYPLLHDLRTPVNHIIGYTEMVLEDLAESGTQSKVIPDLQKIIENVKRWLVLVERYTGAPELPSRSPDPLDDLPSPDKINTPGWILSDLEGFRVKKDQTGHILVVDDDPQNRDILNRRLRQQGHLVDCLESGEAALEWITHYSPDLVLLDMLMPGLTGREVLAAMKQIGNVSDIPIIVISALDDQAEIARCIELGAEDYLSTPFNPAVLKARISTCLEKRRLRQMEISHLARLEEEKLKSERLLLNILPEPVADRLKAGENIIADYFSEVTVIFADLVNFTELTSEKEPEQIVGMLNQIFSRLDLIAQKHGLEKIKTIGDAYMAVGGLPTERQDHAEAVARFALDLSAEISRFDSTFGHPLAVRVGIDTGPVIAGIIGRNKFIYDLWGDTVNIASRMESSGVPGEIQVSESTWRKLKDNFQLRERGRIDIKGKGPMNTWILEA